MSNLNESTPATSIEKGASPRWHTWLCDALGPAFYIGITLLSLSLNSVVSARLGWLGFALAVPAAIVSLRLKRAAIIEPRSYVILNVHLLNSKGGAYHNAIDRFQKGDSLIYDGIEFVCCSKNEVVCRVVADRTNLDANAALEIAARAQSVFKSLRINSAEFDTAVNVRNARVVIMSGHGASAFEICRVIDGNLNWRINANVNHPMHGSGEVGPSQMESHLSPPRDR